MTIDTLKVFTMLTLVPDAMDAILAGHVPLVQHVAAQIVQGAPTIAPITVIG